MRIAVTTSFFLLLSFFPAQAYTSLAEAYAAMGFDPNYPGNKVVVVNAAGCLTLMGRLPASAFRNFQEAPPPASR